jgi:hypothetical protein
MSEAANGWSDFFVAEVGASAALSGLVIVAISINLQRISFVSSLAGPRRGNANHARRRATRVQRCACAGSAHKIAWRRNRQYRAVHDHRADLHPDARVDDRKKPAGIVVAVAAAPYALRRGANPHWRRLSHRRHWRTLLGRGSRAGDAGRERLEFLGLTGRDFALSKNGHRPPSKKGLRRPARRRLV